MALLDSDKKLMKTLGVEVDLPTEDKLTFLDEQISGIKHQMWRSRVDAILNRNLGTETPTEKIAVDTKVIEHEADVKRYAEAVSLMEALKSELEG